MSILSSATRFKLSAYRGQQLGHGMGREEQEIASAEWIYQNIIDI